MAEHKIIISGFGGQGVVIAGRLIATAALLSGKNVVGMVSYGAEIRGGTSNSSVIISEEEINSPVIDKPNIVIALNQPSLDKYLSKIEKNGYLIVNTSLAEIPDKKPANLIKIAATEIANEIGNLKMANIVAIGALLKNTRILSNERMLEAIDEVFKSKKELIEVNKKAFMRGVELG